MNRVPVLPAAQSSRSAATISPYGTREADPVTNVSLSSRGLLGLPRQSIQDHLHAHPESLDGPGKSASLIATPDTSLLGVEFATTELLGDALGRRIEVDGPDVGQRNRENQCHDDQGLLEYSEARLFRTCHLFVRPVAVAMPVREAYGDRRPWCRKPSARGRSSDPVVGFFNPLAGQEGRSGSRTPSAACRNREAGGDRPLGVHRQGPWKLADSEYLHPRERHPHGHKTGSRRISVVRRKHAKNNAAPVAILAAA